MKNKKMLYTVCFMVLCLIDFLRNTQTGDVWKAASNCTGLVLAIIIFSGYSLKNFCNIFSYIWSTICFCIVGYAIFEGSYFIYGDVYKWTFVFAVLNVWWLGIFGGYFVRQIFIEKKLQIEVGLLGVLWIAFAIFMTCNRSGRLWPIWFFFMFSAFYLTDYKKKDFANLAEALVTGTIIAFFILQLYCYAFRPYDEIRYKGAYPNCNIAGLHYLWVYTCLLIKLHFLHKTRAHKGRKLFCFVGAAGMLDFMIMTMCRSAWLAAGVLTFVFGVCVVKENWEKSWRNVLGRGISLLLLTVVLFPVTFATVRWLPTIHPHPIWHEGEYGLGRVHSWDPADSEKYVEMNEFLGELLKRLSGTIQISKANPFVLQVEAAENQNIQQEKFEAVEIPIFDDAMNGRFAIYKAYLRDMRWFGNPELAGHYKLGEYTVWHAQNLWIQVGYSYGIPAGVLLIVLTVVLLYKHWKMLKNKPDDIYVLMPLLICIMFFTFGVTELDWNVGQYPLFLVFFAQHPNFRKDDVRE